MPDYEFKINPTARARARSKRKRGKLLPPVQRLLILAHQIDQVIDNGHFSTKAEIAEQLGMTRGRLTQLIGFLKVASAIQSQILLGDPPETLKLTERDLIKIFRAKDAQSQQDQLNSILKTK